MENSQPIGTRFGRFKQRHDSTLLVPEDIARRRVVIPKRDWQGADRMFAFFNAQVAFRCKNRECSDRAIREIDRKADGSRVFRCGCTDRVLSRNVK